MHCSTKRILADLEGLQPQGRLKRMKLSIIQEETVQ
jgi:hypothetical protein